MGILRVASADCIMAFMFMTITTWLAFHPWNVTVCRSDTHGWRICPLFLPLLSALEGTHAVAFMSIE
jgi:hypothetical protein